MLFIFDMGGVVTTNFKGKFCSELLNIPDEKFFPLCGHTPNAPQDKDLFNLINLGKMTIPEFWKRFAENARREGFNIAPIEHDLFRLTFHPKLNDKTVEIIKALRKNHRVVCGTNTIDSHWENHLERGDYSFFDQTYASNKIHAIKPDPIFFQLIMTAEGYLPSETFFTDDKLENIQAARSLGINAIQFTTADDVYNAWKKYF